MNNLDIVGASNSELDQSALLRYLLDPDAAHHDKEIGASFLAMLGSRLGCELSGRQIVRAFRELPTDKNRRIDIAIITDADEFRE
jgi:hypothetical protein